MKTFKYSNNKDIQTMVRLAIKQGAIFEKRKKHGFLRLASGYIQCVPSTPSCTRASANFRCELHRHGVVF